MLGPSANWPGKKRSVRTRCINGARHVRMPMTGTNRLPINSADHKEDQKRIKQLEKELKRKEKALAEAIALCWCCKKSPGDLGGTQRANDQHPGSPQNGYADQ